VREQNAKKPGARQLRIAGYPAVQSTDEKSCVQDITLGPDHSFRSLIVRVDPDAPPDTCKVNTSFTSLFISKFQP
jgi:hypothetical protein